MDSLSKNLKEQESVKKSLRLLKKYFIKDPKVVALLGEVEKEFQLKLGQVNTLLPEMLSSKYPEVVTIIQNFKADFVIYTDGACRGNPGMGAYAFLLFDREGALVREIVGGAPQTTNNQMELCGALKAFEFLIKNYEESTLKKSTLVVCSDSKYLIGGVQSWMKSWKLKGWKKSDNKVPENITLWKKIDLYLEHFNKVEMVWVKGHAGILPNERCDELCNLKLDQMESK